MFLVNLPGLIGVVLSGIVGYSVGGYVEARAPQLDALGMQAGAPFLGLYGLTVDRCEAPGLFASYRANVQNVFAAESAAGLRSYGKPVVPGRRMAVFFLPVAMAPIPWFLLSLADVALRLDDNGALTRAEWFEFVEVPVASLGLWATYALATQWLRLRTSLST